jgi:hypothetical protein
MWIGWLINTGGIFGSVREIIETSNVLVDMGHKATIYTPLGKDLGWLPCKANFRKTHHLDKDPLDVLFMVEPPHEPYFSIWKNSKAKIKSYCMMGYPTDALLKNPGKFLTENHEWIVKNHWCICDGSWQLRDMGRFNPDVGPAIGGINLEQFHPVEVLKTVDIVWSNDPRPRKDSGTVAKAIQGFSNDFYFKKGIPQDKIADFLCKGRVFADSHIRGGWCNPVAEAMACGVPVVCTNIPCNEDFAIHGRTALLVEPGDWQKMREYIELLLTDIDLYNDLREEGLAQIAKFDYRMVAPRLADAIEKHL